MRVKTGTTRKNRHKKTLKLAKGYRMTRHRLFKSAHEAVMHAGQYAFIGRKQRKRNFKRLWIARINAAVRHQGLGYAEFMNLAKKKQITINRKILAYLAVKEPGVFEQIVKSVKK